MGIHASRMRSTRGPVRCTRIILIMRRKPVRWCVPDIGVASDIDVPYPGAEVAPAPRAKPYGARPLHELGIR